MLKSLRVAVTGLSLTACVLLIALGVRSYWRGDSLQGNISHNRAFIVRSIRGGVPLAIIRAHVRWKVASEGAEGLAPNGGRKPSSVQWKKDCDEPLHLVFRCTTRSQGTFSALVPHWALVLAAASIAAVPWLPGRFSLRTLLIATTLVAVVLGIIVAAM